MLTMTTCDVQSYRSAVSTLAMQHLMLTAAMVVLFVCTKAYVNQLRRQHARSVSWPSVGGDVRTALLQRLQRWGAREGINSVFEGPVLDGHVVMMWGLRSSDVRLTY